MISLARCHRSSSAAPTASTPNLPLSLVADVELPGNDTRFDYQDIDAAERHLVVAHMKDDAVLVLDLRDASVAKVIPNIHVPRGIAVGDGRIFVTSMPAELVIVDGKSLAEIARVTTGHGPDGVAYDPVDHVVGVSDQRDGAISIIGGAGQGRRFAVSLGKETGNVVYDPKRGTFWIAVVGGQSDDELVEIAPLDRKITTRIPLPGCDDAHGVRLHRADRARSSRVKATTSSRVSISAARTRSSSSRRGKAR